MKTIVITNNPIIVEVTEATGRVTVVEQTQNPGIIEVVTEGPQGPPGAAVALLFNSPVAGSIPYYDPTVEAFRVDGARTFTSISDGGNF